MVNGNRNRPSSRLSQNDGSTHLGVMGDDWAPYRAYGARCLHDIGIPAYGFREGGGAAALNTGATDRLRPRRDGQALSATCPKQRVSTACRRPIATGRWWHYQVGALSPAWQHTRYDDLADTGRCGWARVQACPPLRRGRGRARGRGAQPNRGWPRRRPGANHPRGSPSATRGENHPPEPPATPFAGFGGRAPRGNPSPPPPGPPT